MPLVYSNSLEPSHLLMGSVWAGGSWWVVCVCCETCLGGPRNKEMQFFCEETFSRTALILHGNEDIFLLFFNIILLSRGRQIQGARSPWRLNFQIQIRAFLSPYLQKKYAPSWIISRMATTALVYWGVFPTVRTKLSIPLHEKAGFNPSSERRTSSRTSASVWKWLVLLQLPCLRYINRQRFIDIDPFLRKLYSS
jgi:hypothetical protein